jgi:hypothetical protein
MRHGLPGARRKVKLSSFGSFVVRKKGQRMGRNPRTGEEVPIPPHRHVQAFRHSKAADQCASFAISMKAPGIFPKHLASERKEPRAISAQGS